MSEAKRDYYEILGIEKDADDSDIKKAFRKLAKKYHPDRNSNKDAAKIFAEVNEAYEVLSDPEKRANYDKFGHDGIDGDGLGFNAEEVFSSFFDTIKEGGAFDDLDFDSEPGSDKSKKDKKKKKKDSAESFEDYVKEFDNKEGKVKNKKKWSFFGRNKKDEDELQTSTTSFFKTDEVEKHNDDEPRFDANISDKEISQDNSQEISFDADLNDYPTASENIDFEAEINNQNQNDSNVSEQSEQIETQEEPGLEFWEQYVGNPEYGYFDVNDDWQWKGYFDDDRVWIPLDEEKQAEDSKQETTVEDKADETITVEKSQDDIKSDELVQEKQAEDSKQETTVEDKTDETTTVEKSQDDIKSDELVQEKQEKELEISTTPSNSAFDLSFLFNKPKNTDQSTVINKDEEKPTSEIEPESKQVNYEEATVDLTSDKEQEKATKKDKLDAETKSEQKDNLSISDLSYNIKEELETSIEFKPDESKSPTPDPTVDNNKETLQQSSEETQEDLDAKEIEEIIDIPPTDKEASLATATEPVTSELTTEETQEDLDAKEIEEIIDIPPTDKEASLATATELVTSELTTEETQEDLDAKEIEEIIDIPPTDKEASLATASITQNEEDNILSDTDTSQLDDIKQTNEIPKLIDESTSEVQAKLAEELNVATLNEVQFSDDSKHYDNFGKEIQAENNVETEAILEKISSQKEAIKKQTTNKTIIIEDDNFGTKNKNHENTDQLLKLTFGTKGIESVLDSELLGNDQVDASHEEANKSVPMIEATESTISHKSAQQLDQISEIIDHQEEYALQINKQTDIDIIYQANVQQLLLFNNAVKRIAYYRHIPCDVCDATGADLTFKNKAIKICPVCKNNSNEVANCKTCNGFGRLITKPCKQCKGKSYCKEQIVLDIKLPITTNLCLEVTYPGFGHILNKEIKGDFKVIFNVIESKFFKVKDNDVWTLALIDPAVAAVGGLIIVPTLNKLVELKINGGVMNGDELVIKKMGLPPRYDSGIDRQYNKSGDLIVKIKYADVNKVKEGMSVQELAKQPNAHVNKYNNLVQNELNCLTENSKFLKTVEPQLDKKTIKNNEFEWIKNYKFVETNVDQPQKQSKKQKVTKNKKTTNKTNKTNKTKKISDNVSSSKSKNTKTKNIKTKATKNNTKFKSNSKRK